MNVFVNLSSDASKNLIDLGRGGKVGVFPLIYFWLKDYFYQKYESYFQNISWNWHDSYRKPFDEDFELKNKLRNTPPDIFAQSIYMWNEQQMFDTAKWVRENFKDCLIVAAGPSAEIKENFFYNHPYYDIVINGPGAESFSQILKNKIDKKSFHDIDGIAFFDEEKKLIINDNAIKKDEPLLLNYVNNFREETKSVISKLRKDFHGIRFQTLLLQGCPYSCSFCEQGQEFWTKINKRPLSFLLDEMDLFSSYKNCTIDFIDSNFGIHKEYEQVIDYLIDINNSQENKQLKIGYLAYAKQNIDRVFSIQRKIQENPHITIRIIEYLTLQDINPDVLKINGRPFTKEDEKIEKFSEKFVNKKGYNNGQVEFILGMPGQSFKSIIDSYVELNSKKIISSWNPYIYAIFPNTPLTESEEFHTLNYKTNLVTFIGETQGKNNFLISEEKKEKFKNPLKINYLVETPTLSTTELSSALYFFTLFGHVIGFWNVLESPFQYAKNYYNIEESAFFEKILWKFSPDNLHNLPTEIKDDILSLYDWLSGNTDFMQRTDMYQQYYIEPFHLSFYRWMADCSSFLEIFYDTFIEIVGHNDIIFKNLLEWSVKDTLRFDEECFSDEYEISYNYDDIAVKKMPVYYLSEWRFNFEYTSVDEIYKDLVVEGSLTKSYCGLIDYKPLTNDNHQKPLSL